MLASSCTLPQPRLAALPVVVVLGSEAPRALIRLAFATEGLLAGDELSFKPDPILPAEPFRADAATAERDLQCLAAAVYHEARSEPEAGRRAVAQVVLNRVRHRAFPDTVCDVVFQGSDRATGCQFSFTCDGSVSRRRETYAWKAAEKVAAEALAGYVHAPAGLATHYHTSAVDPWWSRELRVVARLGVHVFYRWAGVAGAPEAFRKQLT